MVDVVALAEEEIEKLKPAALKLRHWIGIATVLLFLLFGVALWTLDTSVGHRFIADRVSALKPSSGLRIRIGRIDGSIWSRATLRDVRLSDPKGLFLEVPELAVDWRPTGWLSNRLDIRSLRTDIAIFYRVPRLKPSTTKRKAILPDFDVRLDRLDIHRLRVEPAITGKRQLARILGSADISHGRARIRLDAASTAGDQLRLLLDSEPDDNRFDVDLKVNAPEQGVIGAVVGTRRPIVAEIAGKGNYAVWAGHARADVSGHRVIDLELDVRSGTYGLKGILAPAPITSGKVQRLSSPQIRVEGHARLADRKLTSRLSLRSAALILDAKGVLDLGASAFEGVTIDGNLLKPPALFPNMTGRDVKLHMTVEGPFATAAFDYMLQSPHIAFDQTGFDNLRITGRGHFSKAPVSVPVSARADRVTGAGDVVGGILRNLRVEGVVKVTAKALTGEGLTLNSDQLKGKLTLFVDLVTGRYEVGVSGGMARYFIPGVGIVDVLSELKVVPGAGGRGTHVEGRGRAWVRRFDNAFLRGLAEGLPSIDTRLIRDRDGIIHFAGLKLTAPGIGLTGNGYRRRDGTFYFEGAGNHRRYGAFRMLLDGNISHPRHELTLAAPMDSLGLAGVKLLLDPIAQGYQWRASGTSLLGPFDGDGKIITQPNSPALIAVNRLDVSGTHASGGVRADPGGFTGKIVTAGGGIDGELMFNPVGDVQRIESHLAFNQANLAGMPDLQVRLGRLDGVFMLDPAGTSIEAKISGRGLRRQRLYLGRLGAELSLRGGSGHISANLAGARGRAFDLKADADVTPSSLKLTGAGTIDRRPVKLESPALITRIDDGWRLDRTTISFAGGRASFGGHLGGAATEIEASIDRMPLAVLDVIAPDLGFGGYASGQFSYRLPRGGRLPVGDADLVIKGLTRSGLVLASRPIELALKAKLSETAFAARAIGSSEGKIIGRAQVRVAPLNAEGTIVERMMRAPVFAQLRYNGPADTLWRLTNIESIDLSGPIAIGADISGILGDPRIRGSLKADNARLESAVTGTVIEKIHATGRFGGALLQIDDFAGSSRGGGKVTGTGKFDLAAVSGFGMDLAVQAEDARLLNRDDITATVTGPLTIKSDGSGGVISGDVKVMRGSFRLGQAAVVEVPRLNVKELNRVDESEEARPRKPWLLDLKADARNRFMVTGLGLDSEWRMKLDIKGAVDNPAISGRADLIRGGYEFAGKRFDLDRGSVRFMGQAPPDPVLDIVASANVQGLNANMAVTGTGLKPEIRFTSVPALPEDELLSRLLFGTSITNLSAPEALQLAAAVASLRGNGGAAGLNPINLVRRVAGLDRLRILPADTTTGQGTSIAAGKYIGRRTYVELITDGQGYSATRVEFQITRWLSLLSSISTIGQQSANVRISKDY